MGFILRCKGVRLNVKNPFLMYIKAIGFILQCVGPFMMSQFTIATIALAANYCCC